MCVLFGPEVVLNNVFAAKQKEYVEWEELSDFCNILYKKVTGIQSNAGRYRYVHFQLNQEDLEEFFEVDGKFLNGINRIYSLKKIDDIECEKINFIYTSEIRQSLIETRKEFALRG